MGLGWWHQCFSSANSWNLKSSSSTFGYRQKWFWMCEWMSWGRSKHLSRYLTVPDDFKFHPQAIDLQITPLNLTSTLNSGLVYAICLLDNLSLDAWSTPQCKIIQNWTLDLLSWPGHSIFPSLQMTLFFFKSCWPWNQCWSAFPLTPTYDWSATLVMPTISYKGKFKNHHISRLLDRKTPASSGSCYTSWEISLILW
jgi:hypothetical protein